MKIALWIFSILSALFALSIFVTVGNYALGLMALLSVLIMLPPLYDKVLADKININPIIRLVIGIGLQVLVANSLPKTPESNTATVQNKEAEIVDEPKKEDPAAIAKAERDSLYSRLQRELNGDALKNGKFNKSYEDANLTTLQIDLAVFGVWAKMIDEAERHEDKEIQQLGKKIRAKVTALQVRELPKIRKAYVDIMYQKLWEENITCKISGKNNTVIELTGGYFASNKNIKTTQETLSEAANLFRFKRVTYRWYKGQDDYTYYDIDSPKDDILYSFK